MSLNNFKTGAAGIGLIKKWEGCELDAYPDPASPLAKTGKGSGEPWTIGYGHTGGVQPGDSITPAEALSLLADDLEAREARLNSLLKVRVNQNQFDAMMSLVYNIGFGRAATANQKAVPGLITSSVLRLTNQGNFTGAAGTFQLWNTARKTVVQGLVNRRADEARVYLSR